MQTHGLYDDGHVERAIAALGASLDACGAGLPANSALPEVSITVEPNGGFQVAAAATGSPTAAHCLRSTLLRLGLGPTRNGMRGVVRVSLRSAGCAAPPDPWRQ